MRACLLLGSWLLLGCGASVSKPVVASSAPVAVVSGVRHDVIGFGLSAAFPSPPTTNTSSDDKVRTVRLTSQGAQVFGLTAVSTRGRDRPKDDEWYNALRAKMKLEKRRDVQLGGYRGVELFGVHDKKPLITRLFAVGDTLFVAEVIGVKAPLDEAQALRFLDSLQLELPWRVYASPTTKFSVMIPTHAIEIDKTEPDNAARSSSFAFFLGGDDQLTYWASGEELNDRNPEVTDEQILDGAIGGLAKSGAEVTWQGPIAGAGVRGREFLATSSGVNMMGRIWLSERFLYLLFVSATSREGLQRAEASKFYGSFVAY